MAGALPARRELRICSCFRGRSSTRLPGDATAAIRFSCCSLILSSTGTLKVRGCLSTRSWQFWQNSTRLGCLSRSSSDNSTSPRGPWRLSDTMWATSPMKAASSWSVPRFSQALAASRKRTYAPGSGKHNLPFLVRRFRPWHPIAPVSEQALLSRELVFAPVDRLVAVSQVRSARVAATEQSGS